MEARVSSLSDFNHESLRKEIVFVLAAKPSCKKDAIHINILKANSIRTRGKPMSQFKSKVLADIRYLKQKNIVEVYKASSNVRVRLLISQEEAIRKIEYNISRGEILKEAKNNSTNEQNSLNLGNIDEDNIVIEEKSSDEIESIDEDLSEWDNLIGDDISNRPALDDFEEGDEVSNPLVEGESFDDDSEGFDLDNIGGAYRQEDELRPYPNKLKTSESLLDSIYNIYKKRSFSDVSKALSSVNIITILDNIDVNAKLSYNKPTGILSTAISLPLLTTEKVNNVLMRFSDSLAIGCLYMDSSSKYHLKNILDANRYNVTEIIDIIDGFIEFSQEIILLSETHYD